MRAVDRLYSQGHRNIVFSVPFLAVESELDAVLAAKARFCENDVKVGVFIETPSAVLELPRLLRRDVTAIYIGVKDLSQLVLGADRDNAAVAHLLDANARPVLETIGTALEACAAAATPAFVFTFVENLSLLKSALPRVDRVSLPASDYIGAAA